MLEYLRQLENRPTLTHEEEAFIDRILAMGPGKHHLRFPARIALIRLLLRDTVALYTPERIEAALTKESPPND